MEENNLQQDTTLRRQIGHELVAAHFVSFASTDDAHVMSLFAIKQTNNNLRQFLAEKHDIICLKEVYKRQTLK